MKTNKKLLVGLVAALLAASPVLSGLSNTQTAQASKHQQLTLINSGYVYNRSGKKIKSTNNNTDVYVNQDAQGYNYIDNNDIGEIPYTGKTVKVRGQLYYNIEKNNYVNAADVVKVNSKNIKQGKLTLSCRSRVYTKNGKRTRQTIAVNSIISHAGKAKTSSGSLPEYFFYQNNARSENPTVCYLPMTKIKGGYYYSIGRGHYINAANVASVDGQILRFNGVTTATLKADTVTQNIANRKTKHTLKKGQKVKVDLAVAPWAEDFDGYIYRLHDYPDEYVSEFYITLRKDLPTDDYDNLAYSYVTTTGNSNTELSLYNFDGTDSQSTVKGDYHNLVEVDGMLYLWVASEHKAELFYHLLGSDSETHITDKTATLVAPAATAVNPSTDNKAITTTAADSNSESPSKTKDYSNMFIKASDVKFVRGIKLTPINSEQDTEADQKVATAADKSELQTLLADGQKVESSNEYRYSLSELRKTYDAALANASVLINSDKATVAQVKEATWLLKTSQAQLTALDFQPWS